MIFTHEPDVSEIKSSLPEKNVGQCLIAVDFTLSLRLEFQCLGVPPTVMSAPTAGNSMKILSVPMA
jgi:hypothetical protein